MTLTRCPWGCRGRFCASAKSAPIGWRALVFAVMLVWPTVGYAADFTWVAPGGGRFITDSVWSPLGPPGDEDRAIFDLASTYTVTFSWLGFPDAPHTEQLLVRSDDVTFSLGTGSSFGPATYTVGPSWNNPNLATSMVVGGSIFGFGQPSAHGKLRLIGGNLVTRYRDVQIGIGNVGSGLVEVGSGAHWHHVAFVDIFGEAAPINLTIGAGSAGTLLVKDGGLVDHQGYSQAGWTTLVGSGPAGQLGVSGTINVTGVGSKLSVGALTLGDTRAGTMTVTHGGVVASAGTLIAANAGVVGSATVAGPGTHWTAGGTVVGNVGTGQLTIEAAGKLTSAASRVGDQFGSTGTAVVTGPGSTWSTSFLSVGATGTGTMLIENGDVATTSITASLGQFVRGKGEVTITGAGSQWTNGSFYVGYADIGTLITADGGAVASGGANVGYLVNSQGTATVTGAESTWTIGVSYPSNFSLGIGRAGQGHLTIEAGGQVATRGAAVAVEPGSVGTLILQHAGSTLDTTGWDNTGALHLGRAGEGTLSLQDGAALINAAVSLAREPGGSANATITGLDSHWNILDHMSVGGSDASAGGTATLNLHAGRITVNQALTLWNDATVNLAGGTLSAATVARPGLGGTFNFDAGTLNILHFDGDLVNVAGQLAPGTTSQTPGALTVTGSYFHNTDATLGIEIAGIIPGDEYDTVTIAGSAWLEGELHLSLLEGFEPHPAQFFTVLSAPGGVVGAFSNVASGDRLNTIDAVGSFLVHYGAGSAFSVTQVILSDFALAHLLGDMNLDGAVDTADVAPFVLALTHEPSYQAQYGIAPVLVGDLNQDGSFDTADVAPFVQLLVGGSLLVPEPSSITLLGLAALLLLACRRHVYRNRPAIIGARVWCGTMEC